MKDQNRKQKEPVLEILTNPRTSYRLVDRKKGRERDLSAQKGMNKLLWGNDWGGIWVTLARGERPGKMQAAGYCFEGFC